MWALDRPSSRRWTTRPVARATPAGRMPSPAPLSRTLTAPHAARALAQMCSADTHAANIATVTRLAEQAAGAGPELLALPEVAG